jgi:hypothetical protein
MAMLKRHISIALTASLLPLVGCSAAQPGSYAKIVENEHGFTLLYNGEPHTILGVGGVERLDELASLGGNTIRTWDAEGIGDLLDEAHANGIRVVAGIWLEHKRHGFDYNDPHQRQEELDRVARLVREHRNHPALLAWGAGNEVELGGDQDLAIKQIKDASALIKKLDPHHPIMATVAEIGDDKAIRIQNECPDIDILGINAYGGLGNLSDRLEAQGYTGAWAVTEFGVIGHWEIGATQWGAPYEQTSSGKASFLRDVYTSTITPNLGMDCLGSFAFLWGHKQEKTETWYGMMLPTGETTERVDVLSELWTGKAPDAHAPRVDRIEVHGGNPIGLYTDQKIHAIVFAEDPDGDTLDVEWRVIPESDAQSMGGDHEDGINPIEVLIERDTDTASHITMPSEPGAYRIYATVRDGTGRAGTANLPIYVVDKE